MRHLEEAAVGLVPSFQQEGCQWLSEVEVQMMLDEVKALSDAGYFFLKAIEAVVANHLR